VCILPREGHLRVFPNLRGMHEYCNLPLCMHSPQGGASEGVPKPQGNARVLQPPLM